MGWKGGLGADRRSYGGGKRGEWGFHMAERGSGSRRGHCVGGLRGEKGGLLWGGKGVWGRSWGVLEREGRNGVSKVLKECLKWERGEQSL